jgi:hypothetical protein
MRKATKTKLPKIQSGYAYLDVKSGRKALAKIVDNPNARMIPVTIKGFIIDQFSGDDGTSIAFTVRVESAELK